MADSIANMPSDDWSGQVVLVTGARGFLGRRLVDALVDRGASVIALSTHIRQAQREGVVHVSADIRDQDALTALFERHAIGTAFHLAAKTFPTLARQEPETTFDANTRGSWVLLEAARIAGKLPRIVFSSTDSVYGENDGAAFTEAAALAPSYPYETSKACAEMIARCYGRTYGMKVAFARFCNLYGPGDDASERLIAGAVSAVVAGTRHVLRGDGRAVRNYLYVEDAVDALLILAKSLDAAEFSGEAFNFCDETPCSVAEIVNHVLRLAGRPDLQPHFGAVTPGEISVKRASAEKARRLLGWKPRIALDEGLRRTIAWRREQDGRREADIAPLAIAKVPRVGSRPAKQAAR